MCNQWPALPIGEHLGNQTAASKANSLQQGVDQLVVAQQNQRSADWYMIAEYTWRRQQLYKNQKASEAGDAEAESEN